MSSQREEGLDAGDEEVEDTLKIKPQKHDLGLYTVKFDGEDVDSQAYLVNTGLKAIDPGDRKNLHF